MPLVYRTCRASSTRFCGVRSILSERLNTALSGGSSQPGGRRTRCHSLPGRVFAAFRSGRLEDGPYTTHPVQMLRLHQNGTKGGDGLEGCRSVEPERWKEFDRHLGQGQMQATFSGGKENGA